MARSYSTKGIHGLEKQAEDGLRMTLALALPVVVITTVLSIPLIKLFFERGAFLPSTTLAVSILIPIVMVNDVLFRMITNMIGRTFFVIKDTLTTNLVSSLTIVIYVIFAYFLIRVWGYWGLALAQLIQVACSILLMCILLISKSPYFPIPEFFKKLGKISGLMRRCRFHRLDREVHNKPAFDHHPIGIRSNHIQCDISRLIVFDRTKYSPFDP